MTLALFGEVLRLSIATLAAYKMRAALTVLAIVIGITSLVGISSLIRGFDQSLRESIQAIGPDTIFVAKFSAISLSGGASMQSLLARPDLTPRDAAAIQQQARTIGHADILLGEGGPPTRERLHFGNEKTKLLNIIGTSENYTTAIRVAVERGRYFTAAEVQHRRPVIVLGQTPYRALFNHIDPIGKRVRLGIEQYTVIGVVAPKPSSGGFTMGVDDFVLVPHTAYQKQFGIRLENIGKGTASSVLVAAVPREGVPREQALRDVQDVLRMRRRLRVDQPNNFDLVTQDAALKLWDQISTTTLLASVALSSIALLVGGIGVMAVMTIAVTERTREIGLRKALGARKGDILAQFLVEAVFLTLLGGVLGIVAGAAAGLIVHASTGFPVSLPWWTFAVGVGFSGLVGITFGLLPAVRAARLDPIEALRYD